MSLSELTLVDFTRLSGNIAIFGGSFDPVQKAHLHIAQKALHTFSLSTVVFIPSRQNPLKPEVTEASGDDRLMMLQLATASVPNFQLSDIELRRNENEPSFTAVTLTEIRQSLPPDSSLHLLLGSDNLLTFEQWRDYDQIIDIADKIIIVNRDDLHREQHKRLSQHIDSERLEKLFANYLDIPAIHISATSVRARIRAGELPVDSVNEDVLRYIQDRGLYRQ